MCSTLSMARFRELTGLQSSDGSIPSGRFLSLPLVGQMFENDRATADHSQAAVFTESAPSKRPFSAIESLSDSDNGYDSDDAPVKENCDAIRRKINSFINSGELKVTDFQRACDINCSSYGRFMKLKGPYAGDMNQAYKAAFQFFERRKLAGIKEPTK